MIQALEEMITLLYPRRCPLCQDILTDKAALICMKCRTKAVPIRGPKCKTCGKPVASLETEYCPEDQCDFAIQEDYRLYDNSTAGTLIIGMLYVSPVFVCIALAILSFKTLSTLDHERRCFAVLYSLRADAKMQRASLPRQTGAFFLTSFLLPLLFNAYFTGRGLRGLSKDLLSMYFNMGLVYAGRRQSCLFVCFDKDAVPRYAMLRSTDPSSHVFAGG